MSSTPSASVMNEEMFNSSVHNNTSVDFRNDCLKKYMSYRNDTLHISLTSVVQKLDAVISALSGNIKTHKPTDVPNATEQKQISGNSNDKDTVINLKNHVTELYDQLDAQIQDIDLKVDTYSSMVGDANKTTSAKTTTRKPKSKPITDESDGTLRDELCKNPPKNRMVNKLISRIIIEGDDLLREWLRNTVSPAVYDVDESVYINDATRAAIVNTLDAEKPKLVADVKAGYIWKTLDSMKKKGDTTKSTFLANLSAYVSKPVEPIEPNDDTPVVESATEVKKPARKSRAKVVADTDAEATEVKKPARKSRAKVVATPPADTDAEATEVKKPARKSRAKVVTDTDAEATEVKKPAHKPRAKAVVITKDQTPVLPGDDISDDDDVDDGVDNGDSDTDDTDE